MKRVPATVVTLDGQELSGPELALAAAQIDIGFGPSLDRARLALGWLSPAADVEPGAEMTVAVGYQDETETVLTGQVDAVSHRPWGFVVDVLATSAKLTRLRTGQAFIDSSVADIVESLADEAGAAVGELEAPMVLAAYHVDERRNAWRHVLDLAWLAGVDVSTEPDGGLTLKPAPDPGAAAGGLGAAVASAVIPGAGGGLRYGAELVAWGLGPADTDRGETRVFPYGAGSELGAAKWHIVLKEPECGAPSGPVVLPGALRDREGATTLERALAARTARRATLGRVVVVGDQAHRAGDVIDLAELPAGPSPRLRILRLTHVVSEGTGFLTHLDVEAAA
ncbi:hypothetical protein BH18ACT4_BH18ACT4_09470 [soil metagenome]